MKRLQDKKILLGVSGGIAVYKAVELLRLLVKEGADVSVVMTKNAERFVTPLTFETLSLNPVRTDMFSMSERGKISHIEDPGLADLIIVAPATGNIIGKFASGIADDLLSTIFMALASPILIAPAMNNRMWRSPAVVRNVSRLKEWGANFVGPATGDLACGTAGEGRLETPENILATAIALLKKGEDMAGINLLVTAGGTHEYIDPVRFIGNRSSGKMGYAIASAAKRRGANVTLVTGPTDIPPPEGINIVQVTSANEMCEAVLAIAGGVDATIMAAAVADFSPVSQAGSKIKKEEGGISLQLSKNRDILKEMSKAGIGGVMVGFAAETENLIANARKKLKEKGLQLVVANDVSEPDKVFGADTNKVVLVEAEGEKEFPTMSKREAASVILDRLVQRYLKVSND
ncbi:MAG: bifunctional phosphopantothenoylcysteine decarboxylase/phosphopantothenate--cysteine ligase CoaBC [Nitrospinae bacterium]|nr:bifunctional phosphopantothenoylcysteine decarboxylase/phosphopantothenate--cysteine ligase CoaBC [Nitrospinota bacterium]